MKGTWNFWIFGGDARMAALARQLCARGHTVHSFALPGAPGEAEGPEGVEAAHAVLLPAPPTGPEGRIFVPLRPEARLEPEAIFARLSPGQLLCLGRGDAGTLALARSHGLAAQDYMAWEEVAVANAVCTAEGCLQLAMERLSVTLHGARVLLLGYGRLGRALGPRLRALGARVTVAARRAHARAWAEAEGQKAVPLGLWPGPFALAVNTIPAPVLDAAALGALGPDCLLLDLASAPGGVTAEASAGLGARLLRAPGLPGKCAPETAAAALRRAVCARLDETYKL